MWIVRRGIRERAAGGEGRKRIKGGQWLVSFHTAGLIGVWDTVVLFDREDSRTEAEWKSLDNNDMCG